MVHAQTECALGLCLREETSSFSFTIDYMHGGLTLQVKHSGKLVTDVDQCSLIQLESWSFRQDSPCRTLVRPWRCTCPSHSSHIPSCLWGTYRQDTRLYNTIQYIYWMLVKFIYYKFYDWYFNGALWMRWSNKSLVAFTHSLFTICSDACLLSCVNAEACLTGWPNAWGRMGGGS